MELGRFYAVWERFCASGTPLPATDDPSYVSAEPWMPVRSGCSGSKGGVAFSHETSTDWPRLFARLRPTGARASFGVVPGPITRYQPFAIARWQGEPSFDVHSGEVRRDVSIYPWWNHWPTAFEPSNGRYALAADRASHSSLTHMRWKEIAKTRDSVTKVHLEGMSNAGVAALASLARSWESPAVLKLESPGYSGGDYDPGERAWIVERSATATTEPLALTLAASPASPVENVALVVKGWGDGGATLTLDGREVASGKDFRIGHRRRLEATDLVVFATARATAPLRLVLARR